MKSYKLKVSECDPVIELKIPGEILRDVTLRSIENGTSIEVEIAMRLARSLERNLEMIEEDNRTIFLAFQRAGMKGH